MDAALDLVPGMVAERAHLRMIAQRLRGALQAAGIGAGIHYPIPIHLLGAYKDLGYGPGAFPVAEAAAGEVLSLPMVPEMTEAQITEVARVLEQAVQRP